MISYAIPEKKLNRRTQVSYALEFTTNKAFRQSWNKWIDVEEDHDIVKPFRRFTGGKVLSKDIPVLRDFFNETADEIIRQKGMSLSKCKIPCNTTSIPKRLSPIQNHL